MKTLQEALVVYKTYAKAEGKSPKTINWVVSSVNYFSDFLGPSRQLINEITGDDLRRFIITLKDRPKYIKKLNWVAFTGREEWLSFHSPKRDRKNKA